MKKSPQAQVKKENQMTPYFAVFNNHINNADERAREVMKAFYSNDLKELVKIEKKGKGIMIIFQEEPSLSTFLYTGLVTAFVNEK